MTEQEKRNAREANKIMGWQFWDEGDDNDD